MGKKRHTAEEIVVKLRQMDVLTAQGRTLKAVDVIDVLSDLFILRGVSGHVRSDNGSEFVAKAVRAWIVAVGAGHLLDLEAAESQATIFMWISG